MEFWFKLISLRLKALRITVIKNNNSSKNEHYINYGIAKKSPNIAINVINTPAIIIIL
jgi:hypothetical protein